MEEFKKILKVNQELDKVFDEKYSSDKDYYNKNVYIDCLNYNSYVYVVVDLNNEASIV